MGSGCRWLSLPAARWQTVSQCRGCLAAGQGLEGRGGGTCREPAENLRTPAMPTRKCNSAQLGRTAWAGCIFCSGVRCSCSIVSQPLRAHQGRTIARVLLSRTQVGPGAVCVASFGARRLGHALAFGASVCRANSRVGDEKQAGRLQLDMMLGMAD